MIAALHIVVASVFPLLVLLAALCDATTFIIPNRVTAALAFAFFPAAVLIGLSPATIGVCVVLAIAALVAVMVMFSFGWIGGGDAKLFAAAVLWLGWPAVGPLLTWTAIAGGALAALLLAARKTTTLMPTHGPAWIGRLLQPQGDVPYGVAIAIGALAAFPASAIFRTLTLH